MDWDLTLNLAGLAMLFYGLVRIIVALERIEEHPGVEEVHGRINPC